MDKATQRDIMRADQERRDMRLVDEYLTLIGKPQPTHKRHSMMIRADAKAAGVVTAHTTRVTAPWATLRDKVVGIAPGTEHESDGTNTVLVRKPGQPDEIRTVSSFRKGREHKPRAKVTEAPQLTEAERFLPSQADILGDYS